MDESLIDVVPVSFISRMKKAAETGFIPYPKYIDNIANVNNYNFDLYIKELKKSGWEVIPKLYGWECKKKKPTDEELLIEKINTLTTVMEMAAENKDFRLVVEIYCRIEILNKRLKRVQERIVEKIKKQKNINDAINDPKQESE